MDIRIQSMVRIHRMQEMWCSPEWEKYSQAVQREGKNSFKEEEMRRSQFIKGEPTIEYKYFYDSFRLNFVDSAFKKREREAIIEKVEELKAKYEPEKIEVVEYVKNDIPRSFEIEYMLKLKTPVRVYPYEKKSIHL